MATANTTSGLPSGSLGSQKGGNNLLVTLLKGAAWGIFNALALVIFYTFVVFGNFGMGAVLAIIVILANVVIFMPRLTPYRWLMPGMGLTIFFVLYPILFTVQTSFTNYGDGNLFTKQQSVALIEQRKYVPDDALIYNWTLFQNDAGDFALYLEQVTDDDTVEVVWAPQDAPIVPVDNPGEEAPEEYQGYVQLNRAERTRALPLVQDAVFGEGDDTAGISGRSQAARPLEQRYLYNVEEDSFLDQQADQIYIANDNIGYYTPVGGGDTLNPGYRVNVGLDNFTRMVTDPGLRGPLVDIFVWTVVFALMSVLMTFAMGLFMALVLNAPGLPARKVIRSLLFIPYAIPGVIGIVVWRGMLNENLGIITRFIVSSFGVRIPWFSDPTWAKIAILTVNLWLGYPYMMLITSGALQAIPSDVYEAAAVDGANPRQRFWGITMPLLLVTVGPLLIASFVFNFNNFLLIDVLTAGDPPILNSPVPAGYTDILISYTYRIAFGSDRGADYGYASAITIVIFAIVAAITMFQYRFTKTWEEVGENV